MASLGLLSPRPASQNSLLADGDSGKLLLPVETTATGSHAFLKHLYYITLEQWSEANDHLEATLKDDRISTPERIAVLDCFADLVLTHQLRNHAHAPPALFKRPSTIFPTR